MDHGENYLRCYLDGDKDAFDGVLELSEVDRQ